MRLEARREGARRLAVESATAPEGKSLLPCPTLIDRVEQHAVLGSRRLWGTHDLRPQQRQVVIVSQDIGQPVRGASEALDRLGRDRLQKL